MPNAEEAAVQAAAAMLAEPVAESADQTGAVEADDQGAEELFPEFDVELPADLQGELDEPDDQEIQQELLDDPYYQELNDEGQQLLARARAAEKKAEHYERLRVQDARKNWVDEAKKYFPLSAHVVDSIEATSRNGFMRQAKAAHESVLPYVKQITETANATLEAEKTKARSEARAQAAKDWGQPVPQETNPTDPEVTISAERLARNRAKGDLSDTLRRMMFPKGE